VTSFNPEPVRRKRKVRPRRPLIAPAARTALIVLLALAAIYVILSRAYGPVAEHWAYGVVATVIGLLVGSRMG
jgi:hypothetical protein